MLTPEQTRILQYLEQRLLVSLSDLASECLPGASPDWVQRVLLDLEWLGYIVVYHGAGGEPLTIEMTERGLQSLV